VLEEEELEEGTVEEDVLEVRSTDGEALELVLENMVLMEMEAEELVLLVDGMDDWLVELAPGALVALEVVSVAVGRERYRMDPARRTMITTTAAATAPGDAPRPLGDMPPVSPLEHISTENCASRPTMHQAVIAKVAHLRFPSLRNASPSYIGTRRRPPHEDVGRDVPSHLDRLP